MSDAVARIAVGGGSIRSQSAGMPDELPAERIVVVHDHDAALEPGGIAATVDHLADHDVVLPAWTFDQGDQRIRRRGRISPERIRWWNSAGPAIVTTAGVLARVGWTEGEHHSVHELALRVSEAGDLRLASTSTVVASRPAADRSDTAQATAEMVDTVRRHLDRVGVTASVSPLSRPGTTMNEPMVRVERHLDDPPLVSIVIPTAGWLTTRGGRSTRMVLDLLASLHDRTAYPFERIEIVVVVGPERAPEIDELLPDAAPGLNLRLVPTDRSFDHSSRTNLGVLAATGEVVVLLNDDTEIIDERWLDQLVAVALEPDVALVGPLLRYADGGIQSAGHVHPPGRLPDNLGNPVTPVPETQLFEVALGHEADGVTLACAAIRRELFLAVGGLSSRIHNAYNDVDLALKLSARGLRHVCLGDISLHHFETRTRSPGVQGFEREILQQRWGHLMTFEELFLPDEDVDHG